MRRLSILLSLAFPCLVLGLACQRSSNETQPGGSPMSIELTSTAFQPGATIDDPDAPRGIWVHWVLFNLPSHTRELAEGVPTTDTLGNGAKQGKNDFGNLGYGGPAPPKGKPHRYVFTLYALDGAVDLPPGAT